MINYAFGCVFELWVSPSIFLSLPLSICFGLISRNLKPMELFVIIAYRQFNVKYKSFNVKKYQT